MCANLGPQIDFYRSVIDLPPDDDERLLMPRDEAWHHYTSVYNIISTHDEHEMVVTTLKAHPRRERQHVALRLLREQCPAVAQQYLLRRLRHWDFLLAPDQHLSIQHGHMRAIANRMPRDMAFSTLKVISNGLNTSRRFQEIPEACLFCRADFADDVRHYALCPALRMLTARCLPELERRLPEGYGLEHFLLLREMSLPLVFGHCILHDILVHGYNAGKHSSLAFPANHLLARLRALLRRFPAVREVQRLLQQ